MSGRRHARRVRRWAPRVHELRERRRVAEQLTRVYRAEQDPPGADYPAGWTDAELRLAWGDR